VIEMMIENIKKVFNGSVQCPSFVCGSYNTVKIKSGFYDTYRCNACGKEFLK
jgi:transposase-like protein